jgi:hypothetical protein
MTLKWVLRRRCIQVMTVLVGLSVLGRPGQAADARLGSIKANRILFFGNSITFSPSPVSGTNWTGGWGMAASVPEKDYVHLVTGSIAHATGSTPAVKATYNLQFERNYNTYDLNSPEMQAQLAFKPDIVVVAIGENVQALDTQAKQDQYRSAFGGLLSAFEANGNPAIFVRSCFWPDATKDTIMQQVTAAAGDIFVDQSHLADPDNSVLWALNEVGNPYRGVGGGVDAHPGDRGMKAIADSLYGAMVAHSAPEPGTLALLLMAAPFLLGLAWRRGRRSSIVEAPLA